jgi:hypothetical protein
MLFDVDHLARQLLMDVTGEDAATLLRGWPTVVAAAEELWSALPGRRSGIDERDRPIERLVAQSANIQTTLDAPKAWPGIGPTDPRMTELAETLLSAAALVQRYGAEIRHEQTHANRDLEAARTRIMHGLYVTSHAVSVAVHVHGRDRYRDAVDAGRRPVPLSRTHTPYAIAPTAAWIDRLTACENAARSYLTGGFTQALAGEAGRPVSGSTRLPRALAGWDIQAHRTLAANATPANLLLITRTQGLIAGVGMVLIDAAQRAHSLDPSERLAPAFAEAGRAWSNLASRWTDLTLPGSGLDTALVRAAAEVRAAYRELTHNTTTMASPEVIATRPGLEHATLATLRAIEAGSDLAYVVAEKATNPDLAGPARALSIRAHNDIEAGLAAPDPAGDVVWISPADIHAKRIVPIPRPVAEVLQAASASTIDAASSAASISSSQVADADHIAMPSDRHGETGDDNLRHHQALTYSNSSQPAAGLAVRSPSTRR